ncbi:MAG: T9SS type A sorting domain-containing protein [Saprospiraceae bacterium]
MKISKYQIKNNLIIILLIITNICLGQPGEIDLSFNSEDTGYSLGRGFSNANVQSTALQSDGKIIVVGQLQGNTYNETLINSNIIRLNQDGSIDNTFSNSGIPNNKINEVVILPDDKIIIAGQFTTFGVQNCGRIARLSSNGTIDLSFNSIGVNSSIEELVLQDDGKIIIGGSFSTGSSSKVLRLNGDGTIDTTFNSGTNTNNTVTSIAIDESGNYYVGGQFTTFNGVAKSKIVKLLSDGSIDNTFAIGSGITNGNVYDLIINKQNAIMVLGSFNAYNSSSANNIIALNPNGTKNVGFNSPFSSGLERYLYSIVQLDDGSYIFGGFYSSPASSFLYKTFENGIFDLNFDEFFQISIKGGVFSVKKTADEDLIIGGSFEKYRKWIGNGIIKISQSGQKYINFNANKGINGPVSSIRAVTKDNNGKYLIAGNILQYNDKSCRGLLRVDENGQADSAFDIGVGVDLGEEDLIISVDVQSDDKIIAVGSFSHFNYILKKNIVRLNPDGSIDPSFITATGTNSSNNGFDGPVTTVHIQADGRILLGGSFTKYRGISCKNMVRLLSNGDIDNSFLIGSGFNYPVQIIKELTNGNIMIGGSFSSYNGTTCNNLVILTQSGLIAPGFNSGQGLSGAYSIYDIIELPTSKFLVAIQGDTWNNQNLDGLIRLNADGSVDASFDLSAKFDGSIKDISLLADNKILVGGLFNKKGIQFCKGLVRLESDGQIDLSFDTGAGVGVDPFDYGNTGVSSMQVMDDNSVIIGGNFSSFNWIGKNRLAKINLSSVGLPLTLISFTGQKELNFNQINWTSSFEVYFKGYEVQKSRDGHNFVKIGFVLSKHAKDNEQNYLFSDTQVNEALNYYRLKMVDEDNSFSYSKILSVSNLEEEPISLFPNPVIDDLFISKGYENNSFLILNANGQLIKKGILVNNKINLKELNVGIYYLQVNSNNGNNSYKFVKI